MPSPHYVTTSGGQLRIWIDGEGPTLVAVAGLTRAASFQASELRRALPSWRVIVVEPPGVGGSARVAPASVELSANLIAESLAFLDNQFALLSFELSCALVPSLLERLAPASTVLVNADAARGWVQTRTAPPGLSPRADGAHLNALWSFLRDRRLLRPDEPTLPVTAGDPLPSVADLSVSFIDAVTAPETWAACWRMCSEKLVPALDAMAALPRANALSEIPDLLAAAPQPSAAAPPPTAPLPGTKVWHEYRDTTVGRVHLRRAGSSGPPVLVLPTGGGSSAQFAPVISGLAEGRTVVGVDYFGNGLSDALDRTPTVATLADDAFAVADALGWDTFDVWGSHTGACAALEMAISRPERIRKAVLEAPVMVTPDFRDDLLTNYFPGFSPDKFGLHLQHIWHWRRDMFMFWPWYRVDYSATRAIGVPSADELHLYAVGILESGITYGGAYRAAFAYNTQDRLPQLRVPAILTAGPNDMLANALEDAAALVPDGLLRTVPTPTTIWWPDPNPGAAAVTLKVYQDFLG
ncbi:alpha/beta hydrolase [Micromonospora sp. NBC_01638]|uniref:alpha/beta hydrolase n=1 Tax=Micromonospora sp. NBC_01638 TaxID=2975982 RepID=UPI00386AB967|nr:alpha/beta hydrolase [Micromonospora sp. NBC_01638]